MFPQRYLKAQAQPMCRTAITTYCHFHLRTRSANTRQQGGYNRRLTFCVAGTRYVGTLTWRLALWNSLAALRKSSVLPPAGTKEVQCKE